MRTHADAIRMRTFGRTAYRYFRTSADACGRYSDGFYRYKFSHSETDGHFDDAPSASSSVAPSAPSFWGPPHYGMHSHTTLITAGHVDYRFTERRPFWLCGDGARQLDPRVPALRAGAESCK